MLAVTRRVTYYRLRSVWESWRQLRLPLRVRVELHSPARSADTGPMRRYLIVLALLLAACSGDDGETTEAPVTEPTELADEGTTTTAAEADDTAHWTEGTDEPLPEYFRQVNESPTGYTLDYGETLWVSSDGIARLIGPDAHLDCEPYMGGYSTEEWHDRYADIPGFAGLVCNPPSID